MSRGPFWLLGDPWVDRRDRGRETTILLGNPDPHVAQPFAMTSCLMECSACSEDYSAVPGLFRGENIHHEDAVWLVKALNFAANHRDGPGLPPSAVRIEVDSKRERGAP